MPQAQSTIAIYDGASPPVPVDFSLEEKQNGTVHYVDRRLVSRDLNPEIKSAFKRPSDKARTYNRTVEVRQPIVRTINGVDTVVDVNKVFITHVLAKSASEQECKDLDAYALNFAGLADVKTQIAKREGWL